MPIYLAEYENFRRGIDLHASSSPGFLLGVGAWVFGTTPQATPLPMPPGCVLGTDIAAWQPFFRSPGGADLSLDLSLIARPAVFRVQALRLDVPSATMWSSDVVQVGCQ